MVFEMAYLDDLKTYRVGAGLTISALARATGLDRATIKRVESHHNCRDETLVRIVHALNNLHYSKNGCALAPDRLISTNSRFGSGPAHTSYE